MTALRKLLLGFVGLVLLAAAVLATLVASFDAEHFKPLAADWMLKERQRTLAFSGPLQLGLWPQVALRAQGVSLSERQSTATFAQVGALSVAIDPLALLGGQVKVRGIELSDTRVRLVRDARGQLNIADLMEPKAGGSAPGSATATTPGTGSASSRPPPAGTATQLPARLDIGFVRLRNLTLDWRDARQSGTTQLRIERADLGRLRAGASAPLSAQVQLAASGTPARTLALQGMLALSPAGEPLQLALRELSLGLRQGSDTLLDLRGELGGSAQALQWSLSGQVSGAQARSSGTYTLGEPGRDNARVQARVSAARLDLDQMGLTRPRAAASAPTPPAGGADTPIDLQVLAALRGQVDVSVGELLARGIRAEGIEAQLQGDGRQLRLTRAAARIWGGRLDASGSLTLEGQRLALQAQGNGLRLEQVLRDTLGREAAEGAAQLQAQISTGGRSLQAWRSQLGGRVALQVRDGAVRGINLARTLREAKAVLKGQPDAVARARSDEKTDFSEASVSFDIRQGVARSNDLQARSPFLRVGGEGSIDLVQSALDYTARALLTDQAQGQGAADAALPRGVQVPVRLSGPFDAVQVQVQWSAVAASAAKEALRSKAGTSVREQLQDKLKGLFR